MVSRLCWILLWSSAAPAAPPRPRFLMRKHLEKHEKKTPKTKKTYEKHKAGLRVPPLRHLVTKKYQKDTKNSPDEPKAPKRAPRERQRDPRRSQKVPKERRRLPKKHEKVTKQLKKRPRQKLVKTSPFKSVWNNKKSKNYWLISQKMSSHAGNSASSKLCFQG